MADSARIAVEDCEKGYGGRAGLDDLTELGRRQTGFTPW